MRQVGRFGGWPFDPRQEPYAVVPHVRICAGGGPKGPSLPRLHILAPLLFALVSVGPTLSVTQTLAEPVAPERDIDRRSESPPYPRPDGLGLAWVSGIVHRLVAGRTAHAMR